MTYQYGYTSKLPQLVTCISRNSIDGSNKLDESVGNSHPKINNGSSCMVVMAGLRVNQTTFLLNMHAQAIGVRICFSVLRKISIPRQQYMVFGLAECFLIQKLANESGQRVAKSNGPL